MNLHVVPGIVLIKPMEAPKQTGVMVVTQEKEYFVRGSVMEIGDAQKISDTLTIPPPAEVGDEVLYVRSGQEEITEKGEILHLIKFSSIVGIYESTE